MEKTANLTKRLLIAACLCTGAVLPVQAELIPGSYNEVGRSRDLRRNIPVAINVYAKNGTVPQVVHEEGIYNGCIYDVLRVDPSEYTFLQVDYAGGPMLLSDLYDWDLVASGYSRVGGINASYFSNTDFEYGKPVGAVRMDNYWASWNGVELAPAYGSGYTTAYFNNTDLELRYHGWSGSSWIPYGDGIWNGEQTGVHAYGIDSKFALSGSYTFFANGEQVDLTWGGSGDFNYRSMGRAVTLLAQREDKQYLLMTFFGSISDWDIVEFLKAENVTDALRFDGGGSTQMVYEDTLVNLPYIKSDYAQRVDDRPRFGWGEVSMGYAPIQNSMTSPLVSLNVTADEGVSYLDQIHSGASLTVIDEDYNILLDHAIIESDTEFELVSTSSSNMSGTMEGGQLYYFNQDNGTVRRILRSGSESDVYLVLLSDNVIPERETFTMDVKSGDEVVWSYTGQKPVEASVWYQGGYTAEEYYIDTDTVIDLVPEEIGGLRFDHWTVSGKDNMPVFIPVYEADGDPATITERISYFFSTQLKKIKRKMENH